MAPVHEHLSFIKTPRTPRTYLGVPSKDGGNAQCFAYLQVIFIYAPQRIGSVANLESHRFFMGVAEESMVISIYLASQR